MLMQDNRIVKILNERQIVVKMGEWGLFLVSESTRGDETLVFDYKEGVKQFYGFEVDGAKDVKIGDFLTEMLRDDEWMPDRREDRP
tara:strand:- start:1144 stop:1401 length:258 start_codon:yes stop_codon:yes gene_type:complete